ncbi:hypothetical protein LQ757_17280 [Agromyces sp. SYSU K20354]|uniref:SGNH hydrolase domain-containing protein n=1 Tax=Agromyces cavernae TaxID=2898659 RepID=UPI001E4A32D9|nr:SGNH hydrolase domain-containing protein [Agromyces cavernae]MCD2444038.1 hypothetical protein [Agromyces cavernae]
MMRRSSRSIALALLVAVLALLSVPLSSATAATRSVTVTATVASPMIAYGKSVTVTGRVLTGSTPVAGARVKITTSSATGWQLVSSAMSTESGSYSAAFTPLAGVTLRAEIASTATLSAAASAPLGIAVQPQIYGTRVGGDGSASVGQTRTFSGAVHAGLAGRRIKVERFEPTGWVQAAHSYILKNGTFAVPVVTTRFGNQAFRVVMPSGGGLVVKAVGPFDVGSYGGAVARLGDSRACFGAAALPGPCSNPALGTSITPSIVGGAYASDTQGAFSCYTADPAATVPVCSAGSTRGDALRVAVTGDSHAAMLLSGLRPLLTELNWRLDSYVGRGCVLSAVVEGSPCEHRLADLNKRLAAGAYDVLFVTAVRAANVDAPAADPKIAGYAAAWKPLVAAGTTIVALADNPTFPQSTLDCVDSAKGDYALAAACSIPRDQGFVLSDPLPATVAAVPGSVLLDESALQCTPNLCRPVIGNVMAYRDTHHLSATYVKTLAPYLVRDAAPHL